MFYVVTKYSFDPDKPVAGPFQSEDAAWAYAERIADEEYRIDTEENDWATDIKKYEAIGEIVIKNFFASHVDVTEFFLIEI